MTLNIGVIPDTQVKPGIKLDYLRRIGQYFAEKQPEVLVCIGDFWDMPSLSSYDKGKKSFEGRRFNSDIDVGKRGMEIMLTPIKKVRGYKPKMIFLMGNHEHRADRVPELQPEFDGVIGTHCMEIESYGWKVIPFLRPWIFRDVAFAHYFTSGAMGRPVSSARACLNKKMMSCVQGHQQTLDIATSYRADGVRLTSIIAGASYDHKEDYLGPQGNNHFRGILMLHDVKRGGEFEHMAVSNSYLKRKFG